MVPGLEQEAEAVAPTRERATQALQAPLPAPQGRAGQFGQALGEGVGNPLSYLGPGSLGLKLGGAALSSLGAEGGRQIAEGTPFEVPAQIGGAVLGGTAALKTLGPSPPKAKIPTSSELLSIGDAGYKVARGVGLDLAPNGVGRWASLVEAEISGPKHGFTGGPDGTAKKTFAALTKLQNLPSGAIVTGDNLQAIRKNLQDIAAETQPGKGGFAKPTPDAAAAAVALKRLNQYSENIPPGHVVDGDPQRYSDTIREASGNWGAGRRTQDFDARLTKAERNADRQIAGSLDAQIKTKAGQLIDNDAAMRFLNDAEKKQLSLVERGGPVSNTLRQFGRGGAGVIPILSQLAAAPLVGTTLGAPGLAVQALIASGLYGARKTSEGITKSRARKLAEMLAKRSPEYEARVRNLPPADTTTGTAAIIRALLNAQ
jgi:hypothetical protein